MFFDSWQDIGRIVVVGALAYFALIVFLRLSGKRTLSKMNAFDMIVTVSLGSTLATILLSKETALADGIAALFTLIALQYSIAWLSVRSEAVKALVKSEPTLLLRDGKFLLNAMRTERVTKEEVIAAIRAQGFAQVESVEAVVLETDGTFTVLRRQEGKATALQAVGHQAQPA